LAVVVDEPHLLAVVVDELVVEASADRSNPVLLDVACLPGTTELLPTSLFHLALDFRVVRHLPYVDHVDGKGVEGVVPFDIGEELVFGAPPDRHDGVEISERLFVGRQKVTWSECIRMTPEPLCAVAGPEKRCCFDQCDIKATDELELMSRRASGEATADDECRFHRTKC